jgi:PhzF family phenazine biosynthesis protein
MAREVLRYAAFTVDGTGGNPAGIVLDAGGMTDAEMLAVAADVGYSETAFVVPREGEPATYDVRYFAPQQEVPFCGHATIATGVALAERGAPDRLTFSTRAGEVLVRTSCDPGGPVAELTSVPPTLEEPPAELVEAALAALHWTAGELDPGYPVRIADAGARHLILVVRSRRRLSELAYDFGVLAALMREHGLITLQLVWPESALVYHARDPFPPGGVVEDPATGAAAAAFGGYLRELGLITAPATFTIRQGEDLGRPSALTVELVAAEPGVRVRGHAGPI